MELTVHNAPRSPSSSARARQNLALILPLLALVLYRLATRAPAAPTWTETAADAAGVLLVVGGLWVRVLARQWKAEKAHDGLVTDGLYSYVRHPLYVGSFLLGLGLALILGDALLLGAFLILFGVNHGLVLRREERALEADFGEAYRAYRRRVPALIPHPRADARPIVPRRLREAIVRESDALCIWLALPLVVQLIEWSMHRSGQPRGAWDLYAFLLALTLTALAVVWIRLKAEYQGMIRRERARFNA